MNQREKKLQQEAQALREELMLGRLSPGEVPRLVHQVTGKLEENVGRWHKIHFGRCRPGYLYMYNKDRSLLDQRVTMRGVTACVTGRQTYYYAMLLPGGVKGEFIA